MGSLCSKGKEGQSSSNHEKPLQVNAATDSRDEKKSDVDDNVDKEELEATQRIIEKGFVKIDHFENIYRLEPKVDGAPNFRQSAGFYIFGSGQPSITAHKTLLKTFQGVCLFVLFVCLTM